MAIEGKHPFVCWWEVLKLLKPTPPWLFPYPRSPGSDPTLCYLENQWSYRTPRGGFRKPSTRSLQSILQILRLLLNLGSRSGQMSNFDVSVWRRLALGPAISIVFARNSAKITSKDYWRYIVSLSVPLNTGQGQGLVTKGLQNQEFFFGHAAQNL